MHLALGMCSEEIRREHIEEVLDAVVGYGIEAIQFNCLSLYGEELPDPARIREKDFARVGTLAKERGLKLVAMNGTINMLEPNPATQKTNLAIFEKIASVTPLLGTDLVTLCTGSHNPYCRWNDHPYNHTQEAFEDCKRVAEKLISIAEKYSVYLGLEPEVWNAVDSPEKAKRFLEEMDTDRIRVILDISNLIREGESTKDQIDEIIRRAFAAYGKRITLAHAKDVKGREIVDHTSCGNGIINFDLVCRKLQEIGYTGPIIMHHLLTEEEFPGCVKFMNDTMAAIH